MPFTTALWPAHLLHTSVVESCLLAGSVSNVLTFGAIGTASATAGVKFEDPEAPLKVGREIAMTAISSASCAIGSRDKKDFGVTAVATAGVAGSDSIVVGSTIETLLRNLTASRGRSTRIFSSTIESKP